MAIQHGFDLILKTNYRRLLISPINMLSTFKKTRENEKIIITSDVYKTIKEGISDNFKMIMDELQKSARSTTSIKLI
ncbi:hypothetical protein [Coxiella endosymbiont of Ornithodoros amblus]|uniref:hypothetical protein n=1 Tax=Coxiella endosymbiont of Ornithodoros amblus TaxID=1656166 RepID=UPI00244DAB83|nr:hypothetical protein [Coxiella endosymbiont of Ornithodoros amblus]